ncbi:hypothetical protein ACO2Q8_26850 [Larkinella sp. VNQ87]|uniref:hypothetical protein n=1 Tax=Larkinella sp. VNQ87 TaxID=3400921 RepID=UPI003C059DD9
MGRVCLALVLTVLTQFVHAQSGSFGSTYAHTGMEMAIMGQHNFVTGSGTINAGIVGSERQPAIGFYSFVNPNGSWISASNTAFMDGYVRTYNTGPFTFPIGDNDKYRPAAVSASSAAAPTTAAYYGVDPGLATTSDLKGGTYGILPGGSTAFPTTSKGAGVGTVDNVEYWDIDGATPARITLTWDANTPIAAMVGTDLSKLRIVGWDGTQWVEIPSTVDAGSLDQTTSASAFTGPAGTVLAGSITTNATLVPDTYIVYTLAGACTVTQVAADVTSLTTCSGGEVAINYTTSPVAGGQVRWVRHASDGSADQPGIGDIVDYPVAPGDTPVSYTYTATSAESFGCTSNTVVTTVTVNPIPIVTPSFCAQTICSGQTGTIIFDVNVDNSIVHWERTPTTPAPSSGTGNIGQTLINTGPTSLTYTYKIWAESPAPASCMSSDTITCIIVVTPGVNVSAIVAAGSGCIGQPLSLSASVPASAQAPVIYTWTGPNGFNSSGPNPLVTNSASITDNGSYTVVATDATGCSSTATVPVSVSNCCSLTATAGGPIIVCTGSDLNLTVTTGSSTTAQIVGPLVYRWSGPNSFTADIANPTIASVSATASGIYSVTVTDGQNCTATSSVTVTVRPAPAADAVSNSPVCSGGTLQLSASGGMSYTWFGPNNYTGTGQTVLIPGVTTANAGNYTVVVTDANGCTATAIEPVTVPGPEACDPGCPNPTLSYAGQPLCTNGFATPTYTPLQDATFVGGFAATPLGLVIDPVTGVLNLNASAPGTYTVTYTVQNTSTGCIRQVQTLVTLTPTPIGNGITNAGGN